MGHQAEGPVVESLKKASLSATEKAAVVRELQEILASRAFRNSTRSKQFLSYVVAQTLEGRCDLLKERTIGTEVFQRKAGYATGDDPVVRVKAGEVRRRLEQYYHGAAGSWPVQIELPVGSYAPEFHWKRDAPRIDVPGRPGTKRIRLPWIVATGVLVLGLILAVATHPWEKKSAQSTLDQFWSPVFSNSQPVLICLAKPVLYRPSLALYERYSKTHPGTFQTEVERSNQLLPLPPDEKIVWGDMLPFPDYGLAMGDVYAATRLSALFARMNKLSQVRIGNNYSFEDLRNSPAVVIGAYNNRWTLQMTSNLRFVFEEHDGHFRIQDRGPSGPAESFRTNPNGEVVEDFAIVTRLLDSKTGQVLIAAAGLGANGTQAAGEFITRQDYLEDAFRSAPPDWPKKNCQFVLQTTVTDSVAGPPRVLERYFW